MFHIGIYPSPEHVLALFHCHQAPVPITSNLFSMHFLLCKNHTSFSLILFLSFSLSLSLSLSLFLSLVFSPPLYRQRPTSTFSSIPIELTCWSDSVDQLLELPAPTPDAHSLQMPRPSAQWGRPTSSVGMPTRRPRPARANWGLEAAS